MIHRRTRFGRELFCCTGSRGHRGPCAGWKRRCGNPALPRSTSTTRAARNRSRRLLRTSIRRSRPSRRHAAVRSISSRTPWAACWRGFTSHNIGRRGSAAWSCSAHTNGGSEVADLLKRFVLYRAFYGPAGQQLATVQDLTLTSLPPLDYPVGIIAGLRTLDPIASTFILPRPNDGRVSVQSSKLERMTDHITVKASHTGLVRHPMAITQTIAFLHAGQFKSSCACA